MNNRKLRWWMLRQRVKLWIAERIIEISKEVERISRPDISEFFPIHMQTAPIRVLQIVEDSVQIEHMDLGKTYWLKRGQIFKIDWMFEEEE